MRWKAPDHIDGISVQNQQFDVEKLECLERDGSIVLARAVDVPDHLDAHMKNIGFAKAVIPPPPEDEEDDRAGDDTDRAARDAQAVLDAKASELRAMNSDALLDWLTKAGVDTSDLKNRPLRLAAALKHVGYVDTDSGK